jgi:hypothetical protein
VPKQLQQLSQLRLVLVLVAAVLLMACTQIG